MIEFANGGILVQSLSELPNLAGARDVYRDYETSSGNVKLKSTNPWHNCWPAGFSITVDDCPRAWYIPVGHHTGDMNLPIDNVIAWLEPIVTDTVQWINHNVKYDAHVEANCFGLLPEPTTRLVDTLNLAKLFDSDRQYKGGYGLDVLSDQLLHEDISHFWQDVKRYLDKNEDWGWVPPDVMGKYGCQDVISNRRLKRFLDAKIPAECHNIRDIEIALTTVLFEMERNGLRVDPLELQKQELLILHRLYELDDKIAKIIGRSIEPHNSNDCYEVLVNQYGMPVYEWTDKSAPSFNKKAMAKYRNHPYAPHQLVAFMMEYRELHTAKNFFVVPYQNLHVNGFLHSSYNQTVRTGRMACKKPNAQQLDEYAKSLVYPDSDDMSFISCDYSQIEFRLMVHYIQDETAIRAFHENPDVDFHDWVAEMCGVKRKPGKTLNFMMGFGAGKAKVLLALSTDLDLVGELIARVDKLAEEGKIDASQKVETFEALAQQRAVRVYNTYHETLPGIKRTSYKVQQVVEQRGYVRTIGGRHRHIPRDRSHIGFNTVNQGSAADLMKERTVALHNMLKGTPFTLKASVHDETLIQGPTDLLRDDTQLRAILECLEHPPYDIRVPIRCSVGVSAKSWAATSENKRKIISQVA